MKIFFNGSRVDIICHWFKGRHEEKYSTCAKKVSLRVAQFDNIHRLGGLI